MKNLSVLRLLFHAWMAIQSSQAPPSATFPPGPSRNKTFYILLHAPKRQEWRVKNLIWMKQSLNTIFEGNIQSLVAVVTMGHYSSWFTFGWWFCFCWTNICIPIKSFIFPKVILFYDISLLLSYLLDKFMLAYRKYIISL